MWSYVLSVAGDLGYTGHPTVSTPNIDRLARRGARLSQGRVQKFLLNRLVDFSIKWVGGVPLVH